MNRPRRAGRGVPRRGESPREAGLRRIGVGIRECSERQSGGRSCELAGKRLFRCADGFATVRVTPLNDEVVLDAIDREPIEEVLAYEQADVVDMAGREVRGKLDDHSACGEL